MAVETNARIEFSVASVEEWEKVNPKLHQGEPVFAKKPSGKYILKVGAPGGSTYKNAVTVWDQDDAKTKMTNTQTAATQALASKNAASASASAAKASENAAATSKSAAATSEANAKTSETNAATSKTAAANSASTASTKATAAGNSARAAATSETNAASSANAAAISESNALKSASAASTSAGNAKASETNASASASAAKASENAAATSAENAKTWDPTQYVQSVTESNGKVTVTKGGGESTTFNAGMTASQLTDFFYPVGTMYISKDPSKTKADFPFMQYGTWEEVPANLCLQTGNAGEAGTRRSAGLPNITGSIWNFTYASIEAAQQEYQCEEGAFKRSDKHECVGYGSRGITGYDGFTLDASISNPIYGASDTVQPPAYMIRAWVRTA